MFALSLDPSPRNVDVAALCPPVPRGQHFRYVFSFVAAQRKAVAFTLALTVTGGAIGAIEPLLLKQVVDALLAKDGKRVVLFAIAALLGLYLRRRRGGHG